MNFFTQNGSITPKILFIAVDRYTNLSTVSQSAIQTVRLFGEIIFAVKCRNVIK